MFAFIGFARRNPSFVTTNARKAWSVHKAMRAFRREHTQCAWCGRTKKLEVHHIQPVSVAPELAADIKNMIVLCRKPACHQVVGHNGDFKTRYVRNVNDVCFGAARANVVRTGAYDG